MKLRNPDFRKALATLIGGACLFGASGVSAQDITLKSPDGGINIQGELIEFKDGTYLIDSKFGQLNISMDLVECIGEACPELDASNLDPVTWSVSLWGKRRAFTEHVEQLAVLIAEKTEGKFRLNISYGGLSKSRENLDGIAAGAFEMAQFCAGYHPEKNPSITVLELPFLGISTLKEEIDVSMAVYAHPATKADLARWNATLLMPSPLPQYNVVGVGAPPMSLADFSNLRVRATGGIGNAIQSLGAELVSIPATEVGEALVSGEVNAVSFAPHAHMAFGTVDSAVWWTTNLNPGTVNCPVVVNTDALEALPQAYRIALTSSIDDALEHYVDNYNGATMEAWGDTLDTQGVVQLTLNNDIVSAINSEVARPSAEQWVKENTSRGLPAQDLYDLVVGQVENGS